jgi:hypothetical protein
MGAGYTDCERSFNPVSVPGVRILPADTANVSAPPTRFSLLQQRVGELFGQAHEQASDAVDNTKDLRTAAHERFAELSQSGKEQIEKRFSDLQDTTQKFADKIVESGKDLTSSNGGNSSSGSSEANKKVRVV